MTEIANTTPKENMMDIVSEPVKENMRGYRRPTDRMETRLSSLERHNQLRRISSEDGKTYFDTENSQFVIEVSGVKVVEIGICDDASVGIKVRDTSGNLILDMTNVEQFIQSANASSKLDLKNDRYSVYEGANEVVRLGDL